MTVLRVLHISDLHFAEKSLRIHVNDYHPLDGRDDLDLSLFSPTTYDPALAEGVARYVFQNRDQFDCIVISGDVATTGAREDQLAAYSFVDAKAVDSWRNARGFPTLDSSRSQMPTTILPGNHDRYGSFPYRPRSLEFDYRFTRFWPNGKRVASEVWDIRGVTVSNVMVDFSLEAVDDANGGLLSYLGQGYAHPDILKHLRNETIASEEEFGADCVVWTIHYPPNFHNIKDDLRLINDNQLLELASDLEVKIILAGHTHQHRPYPVGKNADILVCCAGGATTFTPDFLPSMEIIHIEMDGKNLDQVKVEEISWDRQNVRFEKKDIQKFALWT